MTNVVRVEKNADHPYTMISKVVTEDETLSWEARGMLTYLLGKPDGWVVRMTDLQGASPAGRDKTRRILQELEEHKYVRRQKLRDEATGTYYWQSTIYEEPPDNATGWKPVAREEPSGDTIYWKPVDGKPTDGKPVDLLSTDILNTPGVPGSEVAHDHPAISAVRHLMRRYPKKETWPKIVSVLGETPDLSLLRECWLAWCEAGYNPMSVLWATERYAERVGKSPRELDIKRKGGKVVTIRGVTPTGEEFVTEVMDA